MKKSNYKKSIKISAFKKEHFDIIFDQYEKLPDIIKDNIVSANADYIADVIIDGIEYYSDEVIINKIIFISDYEFTDNGNVIFNVYGEIKNVSHYNESIIVKTDFGIFKFKFIKEEINNDNSNWSIISRKND